MVLGGSTVSASEICAATTFTAQVVLAGSSVVGSRVKLLAGELLSVNVCATPLGHSSVNELVLALTLSLNVIVMFVLVAIWVALLPGVAPVTVGATSDVVKEKL